MSSPLSAHIRAASRSLRRAALTSPDSYAAPVCVLVVVPPPPDGYLAFRCFAPLLFGLPAALWSSQSISTLSPSPFSSGTVPRIVCHPQTFRPSPFDQSSADCRLYPRGGGRQRGGARAYYCVARAARIGGFAVCSHSRPVRVGGSESGLHVILPGGL